MTVEMKLEKYFERKGIKSIKHMDAEQFSSLCSDTYTLGMMQRHFDKKGPGCCVFGLIDRRSGNSTTFYITSKQLKNILK